MNILKYFIIFIVVISFTSCSNIQETATPPKAKKTPKNLTIHGDTRIDNYFWLKDKENPEVIEYLKAENEYTDAMLTPSREFQEKLYEEIVSRIKQADESVPFMKNGYYYYQRYVEGGEYPIYCRKKGSKETDEEILLNVNEMAEGHNFYQVRSLRISSNNQLLVFGVDSVGRRQYTIHVKNLLTGKILGDRIKNTTGSAAWANDNKNIFYTSKEDVSLRPFKIFRHKLGDDLSKDISVYHEQDSTFRTYVWKSKSGKYILIGSFHLLSSEFRFLDAENPEGQFKIIQPREKDLEYYVDHYEDNFYIRTNWHAKNYKLIKTSLEKTNKKFWQDIIPHRDNVLLEGFEIFKDFLVLQERSNALSQLRIFTWKDMNDYYLEFDEPAYVAHISTNPEFNTDVLRYGYTSLTTPYSTFDVNMVTKKKKLMKQQEVVGKFDPVNYKSERLFAQTKDGTQIPISLVYRKDMKKENMPLLLYGYGSYGASMNPNFNSARLSLLDRGFIYAIAHIRGGQEMGRYWYEEGKLLKKKNTFTDFIDCAQYLVNQKYTNPQNLFAMGGSAGGLLMGAIINMRPDLFKGVIAAVPWVDIITTMLDDSIPLTTSEYDEWGDPKVQKYYDYMLSYSPYDNVEAKDYPALFVTTGLHDSQVQFWEPAKWVAKLRDLKTDNNPLLLKTDMEAGHGGTTGRFKRNKLVSIEYTFLLDLARIKE